MTLRAKDAQKAIRALLQGEGGRPVVLVGHSLHHDLAALRLDHQPVIDTAMLYGFEWVRGRGWEPMPGSGGRLCVHTALLGIGEGKPGV